MRKGSQVYNSQRKPVAEIAKIMGVTRPTIYDAPIRYGRILQKKYFPIVPTSPITGISMEKQIRIWLQARAILVVAKLRREGKLSPAPDKCEECGNTHRRLQGHHPDYTRPDYLVYLCPSCHMKGHFSKALGVPPAIFLD